MSAAAGVSSMFEERIDPGKVASFALAAAVHLLLFAILVFGVRWQNRPPESIAVELWEPPPPAPPVQVQPEPKPAPVPAPELAPVIVKPEPVIPKPEIAEKAPAPKPKPVAKVEPKPKPVAKVEPKPKPMPKVESKPKPEPPRIAARPRDEEAQRQIREQLNREQASFAVDRERQRVRDQLASDATSARDKAIADWVNKVKAKIRGNVVLPPDIKGNPEAILDVVQLPTGEVLTARIRKSSGHQALDAAIERAILKSSPLPRPDRSESAPRAFELKYRPLD